MTSSLPKPPSFDRPPSSGVITLLAWCVILASAGMTIISFFTLLMFMVGSHGTANAGLIGFVNVVVLPPVTLVAGISLLRRQAWARYYLIALFTVVLAFNFIAVVRANPEPVHYVSPSGVPTTVLPTDRSMFVPFIVICVGALAVLLPRRAHFEVANVPQTRQAEPPTGTPRAPSSRKIDEARATPPSRWAVVLAVALLLGLACGMAWLVYDGVGTGETVFPSKLASQRRPVLLADEPVMFWTAIGLYASIAVGSAGLVVWGLVQAQRGPERSHREE